LSKHFSWRISCSWSSWFMHSSQGVCFCVWNLIFFVSFNFLVFFSFFSQ
jgi:hypothetical protein